MSSVCDVHGPLRERKHINFVKLGEEVLAVAALARKVISDPSDPADQHEHSSAYHF